MSTPARILLADDNAVNQTVARRIVEKLGYLADVVPDGKAAVEAWQTGRYALILMDCHMPVLDGFQATRQIRTLEKAVSRVPIVALTAHATADAAEECKRSGMDEHLTKPIDQGRMKACLAKWLKKDAAGDAVPASKQEIDAPINWQALLDGLDGDEDFVRQLIILFVEDGRNSLQQIAAAVTAGDYAVLGDRAHSLKGASANLLAEAARHAAEKLEHAARQSMTDQIPQLAADLHKELQRTMEYLNTRMS
jgi:two-component system, sensor histidine kinase and response regulator